MARSENLVQLGKRIVQVRKQKGMSQTDLAYRIGKERQSLYRLESGRINPTYEYLLEVAEGLEISLSELVQLPSRTD